MKSYNSNSVIKIEYGNATFHATQQFIENTEIKGDQLIVKLTLDEVRCKANDICGVPEKELETVSVCCAPSSGCC